MKSKAHHYAKEIMKRFVIFAVLLLIAFLFHRIFSSYNEEIVGAVIFIVVFSLGTIYYYFNLFKTDPHLHKMEYIISIIFVFFLTITMFAVIYAEPIENSSNYFMEYGKPYNITLPDAFYFSTTTITTLGYGDITPVGVFRFFVVIEVLMGFIYMGSMIYFILKIFEKKSEQ